MVTVIRRHDVATSKLRRRCLTGPWHGAIGVQRPSIAVVRPAGTPNRPRCPRPSSFPSPNCHRPNRRQRRPFATARVAVAAAVRVAANVRRTVRVLTVRRQRRC